MNKYIISLLLILCGFQAVAQQVSPYSRYGAGDIRDQNFGAALAMGGLGAAYQSPFNLNFVNPASYGSVAQTTLGLALRFNTSQLSVGDSSYTTGDAFIDYLALGLPLLPNRLDGKKWGLSFGIVPFSQMSYELNDNSLDSNNGLEYSRSFSGNGRLYDMYIGTGVQFSIQDTCLDDSCKFAPIHKFGFGVNFAYRFGNMSYIEVLQLQNTTSSFDTRDKLNVRANDIVLTGGFQYKILFGQTKAMLKNDTTLTAAKKEELFSKNHNIESRSSLAHKAFTFGVYGSIPMNLNASVNRTYDRFIAVGSSAVPIDTILNVAESKVKLNFPVVIGAGITFGNDLGYDHETGWLWGFDVKYTSWSGYNNVANNLALNNSIRLGTGFEITPDFTGYNKNAGGRPRYFKRVSYRLGTYYESGNLTLNGQKISQYGMTFGLGLPITSYARAYKGASTSYINLSFDLGSRGTTNNDLIGELYFGGTVGILLNDRWFIKRKYN